MRLNSRLDLLAQSLAVSEILGELQMGGHLRQGGFLRGATALYLDKAEGMKIMGLDEAVSCSAHDVYSDDRLGDIS